MNLQSFIVKITGEAVLLVIILSLPAIAASLIVGVSVALFSATTQIQEQTLSFAPKMIVVYLVLAITGGWVSNLLLNFATECLSGFTAIGL